MYSHQTEVQRITKQSYIDVHTHTHTHTLTHSHTLTYLKVTVIMWSYVIFLNTTFSREVRFPFDAISAMTDI